jgi:hypothetical protein
MSTLYEKVAPSIALILNLLHERHQLQTLTRRFGEEDVRIESKQAIELDSILEEVLV